MTGSRAWKYNFSAHGCVSPMGGDLVFDDRPDRRHFLMIFYDADARQSHLMGLGIDGHVTVDYVIDASARTFLTIHRGLLQQDSKVVTYDPQLGVFQIFDIDSGILNGTIDPPLGQGFVGDQLVPPALITPSGELVAALFRICQVPESSGPFCFRLATYDLQTFKQTWVSEIEFFSRSFVGFSTAFRGRSLVFSTEKSNVTANAAWSYLQSFDLLSKTFKRQVPLGTIASSDTNQPPSIGMNDLFFWVSPNDHSSSYEFFASYLGSSLVHFHYLIENPNPQSASFECGSPHPTFGGDAVIVGCDYISPTTQKTNTRLFYFTSDGTHWSIDVKGMSCSSFLNVLTP